MPVPDFSTASADVLAITGHGAQYRWNRATETGTPVVVTYNFPSVAADYNTLSADTFTQFTGGHQDNITQALQTWQSAGGITFVQVPDDQMADIRFSMFDMTGYDNSVGNQVSGWAYFPNSWSETGPDGNERFYIEPGTILGDVFMNVNFYGGSSSSTAPGIRGYSILLHEIGHALGFKHPFEGDPTIQDAHDHGQYTVLSYDRSRSTTELGSVDREALQLLYGQREDVTVEATWDARTGALHQQGSGGAEALFGTSVSDMIEAGGGNDRIYGARGSDTVLGGAGEDSVVLNFHSTAADIFGDQGNIRIEGDYYSGDLSLSFRDVEVFEFNDEIFHIDLLFGSGIEQTGAEEDDTLFGSNGNDTVKSGSGDDFVQTGLSSDYIDAGAGNDTVDGGDRNDTIFGGLGDDEMVGGFGDDNLSGDIGNDTLNGGEGVDTLNGGDGDDFIFGGASLKDLRDVIFGGSGNDSIDGGYGNDSVSGGAGNDSVEGGFGVDTIIGNTGEDVLTGSAWSDLIFGGAGDDFINGGFGSDRVNGGADADRFFHIGLAGHGSDWIQDYDAATGDTLLYGGTARALSDFQVNFANTAGAGAAGVEEAFVIYRPTGQIMWALVDGAGQDEINLQLGGDIFDLTA